MNMLQKRIADLVLKHDGLNAAARVLKVDAGYLSRLASGEKTGPSDKLLRKLGIRRVVWYERRAPEDEPTDREEGELTPDEWKAMYMGQCAATDAWAAKYDRERERTAPEALTARVAELEATLATVNKRLAAAQNELVLSGKYVTFPENGPAHVSGVNVHATTKESDRG